MALFQWGVGADFWTLIVAYLVVQGLDGNLLVPILFSEAVNLHPLVIILSVIVFGGMWGFWGCFRHSAGDAGEGGDSRLAG